MPEWLSIFLSPDLWESLTGSLWLTGNALFWSLALHALLSIPIAFWLARRQNVLTKLVGFVTTLPLIFPPIALGYLLMVLLGQNGWIGGWLKAEWGDPGALHAGSGDPRGLCGRHSARCPAA